MSHGGQTSPGVSQPKEIAPDVYCLEVGKGAMRSNVYFVRSGASWALIDTASAHCAPIIQEAAETLFGATTPPVAILLTHDHPDHAGSAGELARRWNCWVYLRPAELPLATMDASTYLSTVEQYANPLDRWLVLPLLRLTPRRRRESLLAQSSFKDVARAFDPDAGAPGLAEWQCIPTPGHTPGHVSFFRPADRVLITGDAVLTVQLNSLLGFLRWDVRRSKQQLAGPPWYSTWSWRAAKESVAALARLDPWVLASGHGSPMSGGETAPALRALAVQFRVAPNSEEKLGNYRWRSTSISTDSLIADTHGPGEAPVRERVTPRRNGR